MLKKQNIVFFFGIMLLASAFLMVVANNIIGLMSYRWLWGPLFVSFAVLFCTSIFARKQVVYLLFFGLFYRMLMYNSFWGYANDWYRQALIHEFFTMLIPIVLFQVLWSGNYIKIWIKLSYIGLVFIGITGITTIIATGINPLVVRMSYSQSEMIDSKLFSLGFGSYGFMTALIVLFPILVFMYKRKTQSKGSRHLFLSLILFFFLVIVRAQIFTNILVSAITIIISCLGSKKIKQSLFTAVFVLSVTLLIPKETYAKWLVELSYYFDVNSQNYYKLNDMAEFIINPEADTTTGAGSRVERYPLLWEAFSARPLWGDASYKSPYEYALNVGGHLHWMSRLALWGVFGFGLYIFILQKIFKPFFNFFSKEFGFYYFLSVASYVLMGLMKAIGGREIWLMFAIIIPGLYLGDYYKTSQMNNEN